MYERFIEVFDFDKKTGESIAEHIKVALKNFTLDIDLCRGQSFDNASNMSGKFKGVKTRILKEIPQAYFSSCSAHSLNLCVVHAMETSVEVKTFFGTVMSKNCINCLHRVHQGGQLYKTLQIFLCILLPPPDGVQGLMPFAPLL